jgi:hypothetical protein
MSQVADGGKKNAKDGIRAEETAWGPLYAACLGLQRGEKDRQEFIRPCSKEGIGRSHVAHLLMSQLVVNRFARIVRTADFDDFPLRAL